MKIRTNITIDKEVKKKIKTKAKELGTSFSQVLERLARNFLNKLNK